MSKFILTVLFAFCTFSAESTESSNDSVIDYRLDQLEMNLKISVNDLGVKDQLLEASLTRATNQLEQKNSLLERALGVSVIALDEKDRQLTGALALLQDTVKALESKNMQLELALNVTQDTLKELERKDAMLEGFDTSIRTLKVRNTQANSQLVELIFNSSRMQDHKIQTLETTLIKANQSMYQFLEDNLLSVVENQTKLADMLRQLVRKAPEEITEEPTPTEDPTPHCFPGEVILSSLSSVYRDYFSDDYDGYFGPGKATDSSIETRTLTHQVTRPYYRGWMSQEYEKISIQIEGESFRFGIHYFVYVLDDSLNKVECGSYQIEGIGRYSTVVECERYGNGFAIEAWNRGEDTYLIIYNLKITLCTL